MLGGQQEGCDCVGVQLYRVGASPMCQSRLAAFAPLLVKAHSYWDPALCR